MARNHLALATTKELRVDLLIRGPRSARPAVRLRRPVRRRREDAHRQFSARIAGLTGSTPGPPAGRMHPIGSGQLPEIGFPQDSKKGPFGTSGIPFGVR